MNRPKLIWFKIMDSDDRVKYIGKDKSKAYKTMIDCLHFTLFVSYTCEFGPWKEISYEDFVK